MGACIDRPNPLHIQIGVALGLTVVCIDNVIARRILIGSAL